MWMLILVLSLSMVLAACSGTGSQADDEEGTPAEEEQSEEERDWPRQLSMATGGTGGTYFPLGGEMANIITDLTGVTTTAQVTNASVENMNFLSKGEVDLAFTQSDIAEYAAQGMLMFEGHPIDNIRAIGTLYPETIQIVTRADSGIESVEDLRGKTVSVGAPGSGTMANAEQILEVHGMTFQDLKAQNLAFDESVEGIQDGYIDAAFITAGTPTGAVTSLAAMTDIRIIPIAGDKIQALIEKYPYYAEDTIPAAAYNLPEDIKTVAVKSMLVVREDLDTQLVYEIAKAIFDNVEKLTHSKAQYISAEGALQGLSMELHPGAARYFEEKGLDP